MHIHLNLQTFQALLSMTRQARSPRQRTQSVQYLPANASALLTSIAVTLLCPPCLFQQARHKPRSIQIHLSFIRSRMPSMELPKCLWNLSRLLHHEYLTR